MHRADTSPPWYARWRRSEPTAASEDAADLGTAFGLDLSLAPPREAEPDAAPEPGWLQRVVAPRKRAP